MNKYAPMRKVYSAVNAAEARFAETGRKGSAYEGFREARASVIWAERADETIEILPVFYALKRKATEYRDARKRNAAEALDMAASAVLRFAEEK